MIGYYSCTQMYASLSSDKDIDSRFVEQVMFVRPKELQINGVHISNFMRESDVNSHQAWRVPALFFVLFYL